MSRAKVVAVLLSVVSLALPIALDRLVTDVPTWALVLAVVAPLVAAALVGWWPQWKAAYRAFSLGESDKITEVNVELVMREWIDQAGWWAKRIPNLNGEAGHFAYEVTLGEGKGLVVQRSSRKRPHYVNVMAFMQGFDVARIPEPNRTTIAGELRIEISKMSTSYDGLTVLGAPFMLHRVIPINELTEHRFHTEVNALLATVIVVRQMVNIRVGQFMEAPKSEPTQPG